MEVVRRVLSGSLVVEPHAGLIHQDYILIIAHGEADRSHQMKDRTAGLPFQIPIAVLRADPARFRKPVTVFAHLVVRAPQ